MRKLTINFNDNSKVTYKIKDSVPWIHYWERHRYMKNQIKSAVLQQYPKKDNEPIDLLKEY